MINHGKKESIQCVGVLIKEEEYHLKMEQWLKMKHLILCEHLRMCRMLLNKLGIGWEGKRSGQNVRLDQTQNVGKLVTGSW